MGLRVYGFMGLGVYGFMGLWVFGFMGFGFWVVGLGVLGYGVRGYRILWDWGFAGFQGAQRPWLVSRREPGPSENNYELNLM